MTAELQRLADEVTENTAVQASAIALIEGLAELLRQNANSPAEINAIADQVEAESAKLAEAVAANTPAAESE